MILHRKLAADEAMVVEFADPGTFWMITTLGIFGNSLDYLYRNVSYTPSRTKVDPDGKIRLVMCRDDPGYWNWIDNQGYIEGWLVFRNILQSELPDVATKVVKTADVPRHLHPGSHKITAEERTGQLLERFHAMQRWYRL